MGEQGSVTYLFDHAGIIHTEEKIDDEIELELIDLGMTDMVSHDGQTTVYTEPEKMHAVIKKLHEKGIQAEGSIGYRPKTTVELADSTKVENFLENISQYDDVQEVYANLG